MSESRKTEYTPMQTLIRLILAGAKEECVNNLSVDWTSVMPLAREQNVLALVACALLHSPELECPEELRKYLMNMMRNEASVNFVRRQRIMHLLNEMKEAGIDAKVLKGYAVAGYYAHPECGGSVDTDLLIDIHKEKQAAKVFEEYGFRVSPRAATSQHVICQHKKYGMVEFANEKVAAPDYIHFNSMNLDVEGNLICSFRHIHSILCLDRSTSENQIKWKLSGLADEFGLSAIQKCSAQHTAFVDGNFITVFDNGNRNGTSRVVGYCLDAEEKALKAFRSYTMGGKYSEACGSAQHLYDDVYVIGWGATVGDPEAMTVVDFATGETLMSVSLKNPMNSTYRCLYFE